MDDFKRTGNLSGAGFKCREPKSKPIYRRIVRRRLAVYIRKEIQDACERRPETPDRR